MNHAHSYISEKTLALVSRLQAKINKAANLCTMKEVNFNFLITLSRRCLWRAYKYIQNLFRI